MKTSDIVYFVGDGAMSPKPTAKNDVVDAEFVDDSDGKGI